MSQSLSEYETNSKDFTEPGVEPEIMPNLELSEERTQFQKLAREFSEGEISPLAEEFDKTGDFPNGPVRKAWEIGLVNFQVAEALGGLNLQTFDSCIILEELAAGCSGIAGPIEASAIAQLPLLKFGTEAQQEKFLKPLLDDCLLAGYASQDATIDDIEARFDGEKYLLNGQHTALVNGGHANWYFVVASHLEPESEQLSSTAFIVPANAEGITFGESFKTIGRRARAVSSVEFHNVELSSDMIVGTPGNASEVIEGILPELYCFVAAGAVGVARKAIEHAINYSKERQTFGRPISQHQGIAFMLAEMAREAEAARYLTWQAAYLIDEGKSALKEALSAKSYAQDVCMRVTTDAVQIYGGYGYSKEYPVEKLMRDAKILQISEQSPGELKASLARELIGIS